MKTILRSRGLALGAVLVVAAAWRLLLWYSFPLLATNDADDYFRLAQNITHPASWFDPVRTPVYPAFLAAVMALAGPSARAIVAAQIALGLVSTIVYFRLGELVGGRTVAIVGGLVVASHAVLLEFEHTLLTETLAFCLQGLTLLAAARAYRTGRARDAAACGFLAAVAALCRPNLLVLGAAVGLLAGFSWLVNVLRRRRPSAWHWARVTVVFSLVFVGALAPWLWHVHGLTGQWSLSPLANVGRLVYAIRERFVPTNTPELLALVPALEARCGAGRDICAWLPDAALREQGRSPAERSAFAGRIVDARINAHPGSYARAMVRASLEQLGFIDGRITEVLYMVQTMESRNFYVSVMTRAEAQYWPQRFIEPDRLRAGRHVVTGAYWYFWQFAFPALPILFVAVFPVLLSEPKTRLLAWFVAASVVSYAGLLAATDRYLMPLEPLLWMGVVAGAMATPETFRRVVNRWRGHVD